MAPAPSQKIGYYVAALFLACCLFSVSANDNLPLDSENLVEEDSFVTEVESPAPSASSSAKKNPSRLTYTQELKLKQQADSETFTKELKIKQHGKALLEHDPSVGCPPGFAKSVTGTSESKACDDWKAMVQANEELGLDLHQSPLKFEPNSIELTARSQRMLDEVAATLKYFKFPVVVKGLSSAEGRHARSLVRGRVLNTIRYLSDRGVTSQMNPEGLVDVKKRAVHIYMKAERPPGCKSMKIECVFKIPAPPHYQGASEIRLKAAGTIEGKWKKLASAEIAKKEAKTKKWVWNEAAAKRYFQTHPDTTARRSVDGAVSVDGFPGESDLPHAESWMPPYKKVPKGVDLNREISWKAAVSKAQSSKERDFKGKQLIIQWRDMGLSAQETISVRAWIDATSSESAAKELRLKAKTRKAEEHQRRTYIDAGCWTNATVGNAWRKEVVMKKMSWLQSGFSRAWATQQTSGFSKEPLAVSTEEALNSQKGLATGVDESPVILSKAERTEIEEHVGEQIRDVYGVEHDAHEHLNTQAQQYSKDLSLKNSA